MVRSFISLKENSNEIEFKYEDVPIHIVYLSNILKLYLNLENG